MPMQWPKEKKFEDTKRVAESRKSKKICQCNGQQRKSSKIPNEQLEAVNQRRYANAMAKREKV